MVIGKRQRSLKPYDAMVRSTCGNCPAGCGVKVFVKDGRAVDIMGDEEHPANKGSFCPKGLLAYKHLANPGRLTSALIREKRDSPLRAVPFRDALAFAAEALGRQAGHAGAQSCYVHSTAASPFGHQLGATFFAKELGTPHGPWRFRPEMLGPRGSLATMFGIEGSRLMMNSPRDWANSQAYVVVGCDPAATDPMTLGPLIDARDRSMALIVIDSRTTVTMQKASHALRVRPGTEGLALRGILRLLFDNGHVDEQFVREATHGVEDLRRELAAFPVESAAAGCGVPVEELKRAAEVIGTTWPLQVITGGWLAEERFGDDDMRLCAALVALRGAIGVPGGGLNLLNVSPFDAGDWLGGQPHLQGPALSLEGVLSDPSRHIAALMLEGDPFARLPGGHAVRAALERIPFVMALSAYENATTAHADAIFPVASWLEHDGLVASGNTRSVQWQAHAAVAPGDCRSHLAIWTELANAMGFASRLPWFASADWDREACAWALANNPWTAPIGVHLLDPNANPPGGILWPCTDEKQIAFEASRFTPRGDVRGINVLFPRGRPFPGTDVRFPTSDGKVTLLGSNAARATVSENSLVLMPGVAVDHVEGYSGMVTDRVAGPVAPKLWINPATAKSRGIADGSQVVLENEQGTLRGVAHVTDLVAEGVIACIALPWMHGTDASAWSLRPACASGARSPFARVELRAAR